MIGTIFTGLGIFVLIFFLYLSVKYFIKWITLDIPFNMRRNWQEATAQKLGYERALECTIDFDGSKLSPLPSLSEDDVEELTKLVKCHASELSRTRGSSQKYPYYHDPTRLAKIRRKMKRYE